MNVLFNFTTNWNNKLDCNYFTTLRASDRHSIGDKGLITLKNQTRFIGEIINKVEINLGSYNHNLQSWDYIGYMDTGYSWTETLKIIEKMYGHLPKVLYLYLIKNTKEQIKEEGLF